MQVKLHLKLPNYARKVECVSLPAAPKHPEPGPGEDAYCVRMITSTSAGLLVDMGGPTRSMSRIATRE